MDGGVAKLEAFVEAGALQVQVTACKYPRQLELVDEVPETVTGKFLRRVLRERDNSAKG